MTAGQVGRAPETSHTISNVHSSQALMVNRNVHTTLLTFFHLLLGERRGVVEDERHDEHVLLQEDGPAI